MIGLDAALLNKPEILVFDAHGLASDGLEAMYRTLEPYLDEIMAVYFAFPVDPAHPCHPRARCITIEIEKNSTKIGERAA